MSSEQIETRMHGKSDKPDVAQERATAGAPQVAESRGERFSRKARRARLNLYAFVTVALLVCLVALAVANTRHVKLSWVVGSSATSLVWIVVFSAILGWLLGVVTSSLFRWRTRPPRT